MVISCNSKLLYVVITDQCLAKSYKCSILSFVYHMFGKNLPTERRKKLYYVTCVLTCSGQRYPSSNNAAQIDIWAKATIIQYYQDSLQF